MSVAHFPPGEEVKYCPTAQASLDDCALTPLRRTAELGLGLLTLVQAVPFQRRMSAFVPLEPL
jgi:hypothetical protein